MPSYGYTAELQGCGALCDANDMACSRCSTICQVVGMESDLGVVLRDAKLWACDMDQVVNMVQHAMLWV